MKFKELKVIPFEISIGDKRKDICVLKLEYKYKPKNNPIDFIGSKILFHFGIYNINDCGSKILRIRGSFLFKTFTIYEKQLTPKWDKCVVCENWCKTKDHYVENIAICSEECKVDYSYCPEAYTNLD